jgi:DNA modification methylase
MLTKEMYEKLQDWCKPFLTTPYELLRAEYELLRRPFNNQFKLQEIVRYSNEASKTGAKYDHDTVKPETLTRALILTCSRQKDLVLIPFLEVEQK